MGNNYSRPVNGVQRAKTVNGTDIASGSATSTQILAADGSGNSAFRSLSATDFPALTGDVTTTAGSLVTTVAKIQGTAVSGTTGSGNVVFSSAPTLTNAIVGTQSTTDNSTKAASTAYVTTAIANAIAGVNPAVAVQAATVSSSNTSGFTYNNGVSGIGATFTGSTNTAITIDGFTFTTLGQRLLVKNDTQSPSGAFNGIYYVTQVQTSLLPPILTRSLDFDQSSDINNTGAIPVINGTVNGTSQWVVSSTVTNVGVDPITFTKFSGNPASYLQSANNLSDVASASTAFSNISPLTTKGDLLTYGSTNARFPVGTDGQVLTADSTQTLGIKWAASGGGGSTPSYIRLDGMTSFGSTNTKIAIMNSVTNSGGSDLTRATSAANGDSITVNTAGIYTVSFTGALNSGPASFGASVNASGGDLTTNIYSVTATKVLIQDTCEGTGHSFGGSFTGHFNVNDVIRPHGDGTVAYTGNNAALVFSVSGPL